LLETEEEDVEAAKQLTMVTKQGVFVSQNGFLHQER